MALQQGGMGLILIAPPNAAMFFQGTQGIFMAYSQIGGSAVPASPGPNGQPPGSTGGQSYKPSSPSVTQADAGGVGQVVSPRLHGGGDSVPSASGLRGNANSGTVKLVQ